MIGAHCEHFPSCMAISDQPRAPKCDRADCPGNATWAGFFGAASAASKDAPDETTSGELVRGTGSLPRSQYKMRCPTNEAEAIAILESAVNVMRGQLEFERGKRKRAWNGAFVEHCEMEARNALAFLTERCGREKVQQASESFADQVLEPDIRPDTHLHP